MLRLTLPDLGDQISPGVTLVDLIRSGVTRVGRHRGEESSTVLEGIQQISKRFEKVPITYPMVRAVENYKAEAE
jgi:hypothetical protein